MFAANFKEYLFQASCLLDSDYRPVKLWANYSRCTENVKLEPVIVKIRSKLNVLLFS